MKKYLFVLMAITMALVGCKNKQLLEDSSVDLTSRATVDEFNILKEQARWGNGEAYLKLADCYRDGNGVEQDFVGMLSMVAQAHDYNGIGSFEDYIMNIPEGSDYRLLFEAMELIDDNKVEEARATSEQLMARGSVDGLTLQGCIALEEGDTVAGLRLIEQAATQGSSFAELMLCITELYGTREPDVQMLIAKSAKFPFLNNKLAEMYMRRDDDAHLAVQYLLKADENACLKKRGARWLLRYHRNVNALPLSESDIQRLQTLAGDSLFNMHNSQSRMPNEISDELLEVPDSIVE